MPVLGNTGNGYPDLGGTSQLEMGIIQSEIMAWAMKKGICVKLFLHGEIMTSLDGHGISITLLKLVDKEWLECLSNIITHVFSIVIT